eukprot:3788386-Prymnesium_polylepis.1
MRDAPCQIRPILCRISGDLVCHIREVLWHNIKEVLCHNIGEVMCHGYLGGAVPCVREVGARALDSGLLDEGGDRQSA